MQNRRIVCTIAGEATRSAEQALARQAYPLPNRKWKLIGKKLNFRVAYDAGAIAADQL
jgi:hypothetical protein